MQTYIATSRQLDKTHCNLSSIINECIETSKLMVSSMKKHIEFKKCYKNNLELYCDPVHIKEVILNILENSIEAIEEKGIISVGVKQTCSNIIIEIIDNGIGIPKQNLPQVVDPFFSTKGQRTGSYGIGLTYANSIMEEHNGFLDIYSEKNIGTKVILYFPRGDIKNENYPLLFFRNRKYVNNGKKTPSENYWK